MSWLDTKTCPICKQDGFDPDCDSVDIGVGVLEGNLRGLCERCGHVAQCNECGKWVTELWPTCLCVNRGTNDGSEGDR